MRLLLVGEKIGEPDPIARTRTTARSGGSEVGFELMDRFGLRIREGIVAAAPPGANEDQKRQDEMILKAIEVKPDIGYWLALGGGVLVLLGGLVGLSAGPASRPRP